MLKENQQRIMNIIAKILIAFSLILLVYGVFLDYNNKNRLFNPITDATTIDDDSSNTTVDINNSKNPTNTTTEQTPSEESNENSNDNDNNESYNEPNQVDNKQNDYSNSQERVNDDFRYEIENSYGVSIKFGYDTESYEAGGLSVNPIYDANTISDNLTKLNNALSLYPSGLFDEINNSGIPLTIYLVDSFSTSGVTGLTDSSSYYANIVIAVSYPFEESFFHESYHYIERYMFDKKHLVFTNWNNYNPPGFVYGEINHDLSFASNGGREDSYFVNNYAQTSEAEDRASTFEYMMDYYKSSCLNHNSPIWRKAKLMSEAIDAAVDSCSPDTTEYWERFL